VATAGKADKELAASEVASGWGEVGVPYGEKRNPRCPTAKLCPPKSESVSSYFLLLIKYIGKVLRGCNILHMYFDVFQEQN